MGGAVRGGDIHGEFPDMTSAAQRDAGGGWIPTARQDLYHAHAGQLGERLRGLGYAVSGLTMSAVCVAQFSAALFRPHVGDTFVFERPEGGEARMQLLEVGGSERPFSLLFVMREGQPLGWGLPRLVRAGFEPCEIFLSRVTVPRYQSADSAGMYYEAVFG